MKKGKLKIITGCMFTEKSKELIETALELEKNGLRYIAFSTIKSEIFSRALDHRVLAHHIKKEEPYMILYHVGSYTGQYGTPNTILIDEVQFFNNSILDIINSLLDQGINIIAGGLDLSFKAEPFDIMQHLLCSAYDIKKKHTTCAKCGSDEASISQRLLNGNPAPFDGPLVILDKNQGEYTYEPRCVDCYEKA